MRFTKSSWEKVPRSVCLSVAATTERIMLRFYEEGLRALTVLVNQVCEKLAPTPDNLQYIDKLSMRKKVFKGRVKLCSIYYAK